jgi:tripartite-type tricarboxylate transporter receptor subunit TctC
MDRGVRALRIWSCLVMAALALALAPWPAAAQSIADHFRGKTIRLLVPSAPGGDRALYPLTFAPYFSKNLPGNPNVQVVFMPGAGGSTAVNNAYGMAAPDGLTLVTPLVGLAASRMPPARFWYRPSSMARPCPNCAAAT